MGQRIWRKGYPVKQVFTRNNEMDCPMSGFLTATQHGLISMVWCSIYILETKLKALIKTQLREKIKLNQSFDNQCRHHNQSLIRNSFWNQISEHNPSLQVLENSKESVGWSIQRVNQVCEHQSHKHQQVCDSLVDWSPCKNIEQNL